MNIPSSSALGVAASTQYATSVHKLAQDQAKVDGQAAVALIDGAQPEPPPPGPEGQGTHVNRYA
jgi:hypothetical protein